MGIGFQVISCPIGKEPTAVTTPEEGMMVIVSEVPHVDIDPQAFAPDSKEVVCPEGHSFYVYTLPDGLIPL